MLPCKLSRAQDGAGLFVFLSGQKLFHGVSPQIRAIPGNQEKKKLSVRSLSWLKEHTAKQLSTRSPTHSVPKVPAEPPGT